MVKKVVFVTAQAKWKRILFYINIAAIVYATISLIYFLVSSRADNLDVIKNWQYLLTLFVIMISIVILIQLINKLKFLNQFTLRYDNNSLFIESPNGEEKFDFSSLPITEVVVNKNRYATHIRIKTAKTQFNLEDFHNFNVIYNLIQTQNSKVENLKRQSWFDATVALPVISFSILATVILMTIDLFVFPLNLSYSLLILLLTGAFMMSGRPLAHTLGNQFDTAESVLASLLIIPFCAQILFGTIMPEIMRQEDSILPCGESHPLLQCYNLNPEVCGVLWRGSENYCLTKHKKEMDPKNPAQLIGPIVNKCREYEYDKKAIYMRKTGVDEPACRFLFYRIKKYKEENTNDR